MSISKADIKNVATLARLNLQDEDVEKFTKQVSDILSYMNTLNKINTTDIEPTSHAVELTNAFREDIVKTSYDTDSALSNAPDSENGCFIVPKVVQ